MHSVSRNRIGIVLACLVWMAGCGGGDTGTTQKLVAVSGTLKIDGAPISNAIVNFIPEGTTSGDSFYGTTDDAGEFLLSSRTGQEGCGVGLYKVIFSKMAMKDGSPSPEGSDAITSGATEQIPPKFNNPEMSQVMADVPEGGKVLDFDLKSE